MFVNSDIEYQFISDSYYFI